MLQGLLEQVKRAIFDDPSTPHQPGHDPSGLIGNIEQLFGQHHPAVPDSPGGTRIRPASEDPHGDPADVGGTRIRPASEDPYGDPADQERRV